MHMYIVVSQWILCSCELMDSRLNHLESIPRDTFRTPKKTYGGQYSLCQLCGAHDSWKHALIDYTMSTCIWDLVDDEITEHMPCTDDGDARSWLVTWRKTTKLGCLSPLVYLACQLEGYPQKRVPESVICPLLCWSIHCRLEAGRDTVKGETSSID
jgi:hypothetical protein